jgi:hypothetical protein
MIMAVIALLVGRLQYFASLHFVLRGILLVHPTPKNQVYSNESTINFYAWYFHVLPFKKPSKYFSFCDTIFSSWGRSGRIFSLLYCFIPKKGKKEKRKEGTPPWYVKVGGHPIKSVSHG